MKKQNTLRIKHNLCRFVLLALFVFVPTKAFAVVSADQALADFGTNYFGDIVQQKNIVLTNNGEPAIILKEVNYSSTSFATLIASGSPTIQAEESYTLRVKLTETAVGTYNERVTFRFENQADIVVDLKAVITERPLDSWMFFFTKEEINIDCTTGADYCEASVPFEIVSNGGCLSYADPIEFATAVANDIELSFNPCSQIYHPDLMGDPSYAMVYEETNGGCATETTAECTVVAKFVRPSISTVSEDCRLTGQMNFTISGGANVGQCTNLKVSRQRQAKDPVTGALLFEANGITPIMETYDHIAGENLLLQTAVKANFPGLGGTSSPDNIQISVTKLNLPPIQDLSDLTYYSAFIKVINIDNQIPSVDFALRHMDAKGGFVALPANITIEKVEWTADDVVVKNAAGADAFQFLGYVYNKAAEHMVRAIVYASFLNKAGAKVNLIMKSNELRLYTPNSLLCEDETPPKIFTIPPVMRPDRAPTRPIYTNINVDQTPDYGNHSGVGDLNFIKAGWWHGGAAKDGTWDAWINDNTRRVGRRKFTFINALPWEIYQLCPISDVALPANPQGETVTLPGTAFGYYNACADPTKLGCPIEQDGKIAWNLTWTVYGWLCIRQTCMLLPDGMISTNEGEAWGCDE